MSIAFNILLLLVISVPVLAVSDGFVARQMVALLTALCLVTVAVAARAADVNQTAQLTRRLKLAAVIPAIWMSLQAIPLPIHQLSHSIWTSAADALQENFWGHVSVDPGSTALALTSYLAGMTLILVTIFVTRDRRRAELMLQGLCAVTIVAVIGLTIARFGNFVLFDGSVTNTVEALTALSALGTILGLAAIVRVFERYESRRGEAGQSLGRTTSVASIWAAGVLICVLAFASAATANIAIVTLLGVVTFALVQAIRRFDLPPWSIGALCATVIAAAAMIVVWRYDAGRSVGLVLQFAITITGDALSTAQRMVSDASPFGNGAGTYTALSPIYQDSGAGKLLAPTLAASLAIEWGRPALAVAIVSVVWLLIILFRGALSRGRDSFYPAAAAACVVILLGEAFCDDSFALSAVAVVSEIMIGLGLAQSVSRAGTG